MWVCFICKSTGFDFQLCIMTAIWILDENRKRCDHINGILVESLVQINGERFTFFFLNPCFPFFVQAKMFLVIYP